MDNAVTMHSLFGLPHNVNESTKIVINDNDSLMRRLVETDVFIIDEASAINKHQLKYIEMKLRFLMGNNQLFGGKVIILGGDFRQCLPIS